MYWATNLGVMHAGVAHTGIWPGGLRNRTGGGETDVELGYSVACHECSAAKAHRAAEEDQVFGVKFSKVLIQRLLYSKCTRALTCENLSQVIC